MRYGIVELRRISIRAGDNQKMCFRRLSLLLACIGIFTTQSTFAQSNSSSEIKTVRHKDWAVQCKASGQNSSPDCFMFQRILVKESGESLLRMTVDKPQDLTAPRAVIVIPLGTYVTPGVLLKVDTSEPIELKIEYCDKQGCYAGVLLEQSILNLFKRGRQAVVSFQNRSRQVINLPISLSGFSSGLASFN